MSALLLLLPLCLTPPVEFTLVRVADPGNEALPIDNFNPQFPEPQAADEFVGAVAYEYEIGRFEVTVTQYVRFLNAVDPEGTNARQLWDPLLDPSTNPKYGSIRRVADAPPGEHFQIAFPVWANKPIGFVDFFRAARFINSLHNGEHSREIDSTGAIRYLCHFSPQTETGAYDLRNQATFGSYATRGVLTGFVLPSQDEWIKAAYYTPELTPAGRHYWRYPERSDETPTAATCDPCGHVTNAEIQPLACFNNITDWCPASCPDGDGTSCPDTFFVGNLVGVGECNSPSPWGTFDQGGNVVEWTDTVVPPIAGAPNPQGMPIWRQMHGGIAVAGAWQLWMSATGASDPFAQVLGNTRAFGGLRVAFLPGGAAPTEPGACDADMTGDGEVNGEDLSQLLSRWGLCR